MNVIQLRKTIDDYNNKPLVIIDKIIESFRQDIEGNDAEEILSLLAISILQFLNFKEEDYKRNPVDYLFKKDLEFNDRKFIAICLLRVFSYNKDLFGGKSLFHRTMELFDDIFKKSLYPWLHVDIKKDETFTKLSKLTSLIREFELELSNSIFHLSSLRSYKCIHEKI